MTSAWSFTLARLLAALGLGLIGGLVFGHLFIWLAAVLAAYLALQLVNLYRLESWLRLRNYLDPPDIGGAWAEIVSQVVRLQRRKRFHKQRLIRLFRELRRSTAAMPEGVIVLNANLEILWFNRTAARLLGLQRKVDRGLRIDNLIRAPDFVRYLQEDDRANAIVITWPAGAELSLSLQLIPYGGGQQLMLVRDVTRQMKLESMRQDFVANASHELRSPLTVIAGYLDTLSEDSALDPTWIGPIGEMRRQAERMRAIVNDLLELSRLESATGDAGDEPVDVGGMLSLLRKEVLALPKRPQEFILKVESRARLAGEEAEIHSAFSNLIANAVKYTPPEGRIEVRWWTDAAGAHLSVRDTGIGIPAEHIPRITERFYRVDPGRSRQHGGSGLGLAIVKHVLQRHGGRLEIESEVGAGSQFTCHFPRRRVVEATQLDLQIAAEG